MKDTEADNATYRAIGLFLTKFAFLEHSLRYFLCAEVGMSVKFMNRVITHDFAMLCSTVLAVFSETLETEDEKNRLKSVISRARELNNLRVKVAHGKSWWTDYESGMLFHVSRQTLREQEVSNVAALLEGEAGKCLRTLIDFQLIAYRIDPRDEPPVDEEKLFNDFETLIQRWQADEYGWPLSGKPVTDPPE
ncbi:hypothetical protein ACQR1I_04690 [Bradyrhizobium sp. HKCCYLS2038]|uniref:hypothetical protein n=1 Tax=unclassified Bradyrhizobium TaxID=2631580 RepID=UPI003EBE5ADB